MKRVLQRVWLAAGLLALLPAWAAAQGTATVTGRVTSETGAPLSSASVVVEGMNLGTLTNEEGRYSIVIPASRLNGQEVTVTVTLLGYQTQEVAITLAAGTITRDFQMPQDVLLLDEIVVTGQGTTQERVRLGTVINSVRAAEIEKSNEPNVVAALAGKAPNVQVTSTAGDPGAGAYIRIRGAASIVGGTQPLFVVDGTPIDNSSTTIESSVQSGVVTNRAADINPNDIESIEILKGAAAAALYGSRAANGVVLITTKSGRPGSNRVTYGINYSVDDVTSTVPLQLRYGLKPGSNRSWGPELDCWPNCVVGENVFNHSDELYETGSRLDQNLTWSGGSERTTYYLSIGHLGHDGVMKGDQSYDRTSVRLKGTHAFLDNLRIGGNFAFTSSEAHFIEQGSNTSGIQLAALRTPPDFNNQPYLDPETGLHRSYQNPNPTTLTGLRGFDNPFWVLNEVKSRSDVGRTFANITVDYEPLPWLTLNYTLGADYGADERFVLYPKSSSNAPEGLLIRADLVRLQVDHSLLATADHVFSEDLAGRLILGQNLNHQEFRRYQINGTNVIDGTDQLDFTISQVPNEFKQRVRTDGYFAQAEVDLYDQLYLTGRVRADGSSTFGGKDKRFIYPGVTAAWEFTKLPALEGLPLDFGKLRGSFGVTGRQPPVFSNVSAFAVGLFGDALLQDGLLSIYNGMDGVFTAGTLGNPDIEPEREREFEAGIDLAFLDQRVSLGATYYTRKTEDAIMQLPVARSTGYFSRFDNVGAWENKGWELTLDLIPVRSENFSWNINAQWAKNESCLTELAGAEEISIAGFTGSTYSLVAPDPVTGCHPWGVIYGTDFVRFGRGLVVGGVNIDEAYPDAAPGTLYLAENGFPVEDPQSRVLGDPNPDWTAGIRSTFTIGDNLQVSGLIDFKHGGDMWNGTRGALYDYGTHKDTEKYHAPGGAPHVFEGAGPGAGKTVNLDESWFRGDGGGFNGPASQFVEDAGFVKLRDISISYTVTQDWLQRLGFSSAALTVSGRNLKTWTDYTGIDPESNLAGQGTGRGLDYFNNPQTRSFVFGMTLTR